MVTDLLKTTDMREQGCIVLLLFSVQKTQCANTSIVALVVHAV